MSTNTFKLINLLQEALKNLEGYSLVSTDLLIKLKDDSDFLECLEIKGIKNWDGYDEAKEMFYDED